MRDYPDLTGNAQDIEKAELAARVRDDFVEMDAAAWRDFFWADITAVLAERDPAGLREKLFDLQETTSAWVQALETRTLRGNEQGT